MKIRLTLLVVCCLFGIQAYSQQVLGNFSAAETFEWPQVVWYRDLANNWDEGLIKMAPNVSGILRSGFGIHLHQSRQFTFWSTGLDPLLSIEGGSGKTYIKGNVGIGTINPIGKLDVRGSTFIGTNDLVLGSTGSFVQIDQGAGSGNSYTQIRAFSNGGNAVNNLVLQNSGGNVGIGTSTPNEKLAVNGNVRAKEIKVEATNWPDYVFDQDYQLLGLQDLDSYIKVNKHLPEMPSAAAAEKDGVELGEMNKLLLKKIEELTLHLIDLDKKVKVLEADNKNLKSKNDD